MKKQAKEWLHYAYTDLLTSKKIIDDENLSAIVAFHTQQCIEKSFKALLENSDKKIPKIHDLRKLWKIIEESIIQYKININFDILDEINQVYIDTRYPADFGILPEGKPSTEKVKTFLELAENIYTQIEKYLE